MEPSPKPETPRNGKYCPRCHAMAPRDQAQCRQCGHQFRTGPDSLASTLTAAAQSTAPDPLHRTMQFVLPPLSPHSAAPASPAPRASRAGSPRYGVFAGVFAAALLCLAVFLGWQWKRLTPPRPSPVGVWETTLHGKASAKAHLEFALQAGGTGRFSWREAGPAASSGQTPLRWHLQSDGRLALALTPPAGGDSISEALAGIFSSHSWTWHVEQSPRRLVLGTLVLTGKP